MILILLICIVQMSGLNIYSYVEDADVQFYRTQKSLAKRMDILDWIPGSYVEEIVEGGENPLDMARRINPGEFVMRAPVQLPEPLIELHPGNPSVGAGGEVGEEEEEEEEEEKVEGEVEEGATGFTQESEAPQRKKAMRAATPQSKLVPVLTVDDARDMYSRDATATFRERRRLKGKKLYGDYAVEETIAISSEDEDDMELAKRLRSDPPSPTAFAGMVRVKPEVLTVEEANAKMLRDEEQRVRLEKAAAEEPSVRNEVAELRALLLEQERQRAMAQPPSSADLITQVIQGMLAQGLVMAPPSSFPALARRLPSPGYRPAARAAAVLQLRAYAAASRPPIRARPAGGRPQPLARHRSFQLVGTPAASASHPRAPTPPPGRPPHVWVVRPKHSRPCSIPERPSRSRRVWVGRPKPRPRIRPRRTNLC